MFRHSLGDFRFLGSLALVVILLSALPDDTSGQLRVVTYNTANSGDNNGPSSPRSGMDVVLEAIGNESVNGIAKPVDVLLLQEQESSATTTQQIVNLLNGIYGAGTYARHD